MSEEMTLRLEEFNGKEYILADNAIHCIGEHRRINSELHEEIERLKEQLNDEIDDELKQSEIMVKKQEEEIERLNNIINELDKELDRGYRDLFEHELVPGRELIANIKNYLQELKGEDKE